MSARVNVRMSKIMCTPVKVFTRMYVTYANCRTLLAIILSEIVISHWYGINSPLDNVILWNT